MGFYSWESRLWLRDGLFIGLDINYFSQGRLSGDLWSLSFYLSLRLKSGASNGDLAVAWAPRQGARKNWVRPYRSMYLAAYARHGNKHMGYIVEQNEICVYMVWTLNYENTRCIKRRKTYFFSMWSFGWQGHYGNNANLNPWLTWTGVALEKIRPFSVEKMSTIY